MDLVKKYSLYFLILVYVSGSIGFVLRPAFFAPFTPFTLLFTCFVYLMHQPYSSSRFVLSYVSIALLGYLVEVLGVSTGIVFGQYKYGDGLGYSYWNVPLVISLNWALIVSSGICVSKKLFESKYIVLGFTALIATSVDFLIEQVAPKLDFWRFAGGMPGLHNYVGWAIVSFCCAYLFYPVLTKGKFYPAIVVLLLQIQFFGTIYLFNN